MKKVLVLALSLLVLAGGAQAQKKNAKSNAPKNAGMASVAVNTKPISLPPAGVGMEMPLAEALNLRATNRAMTEEELPLEVVSSLLWAAYGINRPEEQLRTAPSATNVQEFDVYLFTHEAVYLYDAKHNALNFVAQGDHRAEISSQKHFAVAPVSVVIVANYDRMKRFTDTEVRDFYAAMDCGYVSQNIYLYCASAKLATVACGAINREDLAKLLGIKNGKAMLAHPVSFMR